MTRLEILGDLEPDLHGPLAEGVHGSEDLWSLLVAYGRIFWPPDGQTGWFAGLDAQIRDAEVEDGPLAIVETSGSEEDALCTGLVLAVTQVLRMCGHLQLSGLRVSAEVSDAEPSWQSRSWIANLAHHTDTAEGIRVQLRRSEPADAGVLPPAPELASRVEELLSLAGRDYPCAAVSSPTGVDIRVRSMRWTDLHGAYLVDLSCFVLHEAGFRGDVTISIQPDS